MTDHFARRAYLIAILILGLLALDKLPGLLGNSKAGHEAAKAMKEIQN
jgi:hypothetical protein